MDISYNPTTKTFQIPENRIQLVFMLLKSTMKSIRKMAGLPMDKYQRAGSLKDVDFAQKSILDTAKVLGLDIGGEWG